MLGATNTVEVLTLCAALVAASASIVSVVIAAALTERAQHKKWQRNLRVEIYPKLDNLANEYVTISDSPNRAANAVLEALTNEMLAPVGDAQTYGSTRVGEAAQAMFQLILVDAYHASPPANTWNNAVDAHTEYREAIRKTLLIPEK
jgi:hypothetical protein